MNPVVASRRAALVVGALLLASCGARTHLLEGENDDTVDGSGGGGSFAAAGASATAGGGAGGGAGTPAKVSFCVPGVGRDLRCVQEGFSCVQDMGTLCWCADLPHRGLRWQCRNPDGS